MQGEGGGTPPGEGHEVGTRRAQRFTRRKGEREKGREEERRCATEKGGSATKRDASPAHGLLLQSPLSLLRRVPVTFVCGECIPPQEMHTKCIQGSPPATGGVDLPPCTPSIMQPDRLGMRR